MLDQWLTTSLEAVGLVAFSASLIYLSVIALTRINGLRSFSQMSAFDFAMTVAIGTLISSTASSGSPPLLQAIAALAVFYALQFSVAQLRVRVGWFRRSVDNRPTLLMRDGRFITSNLKRARVTEDDVWGQLRRANVLRTSDVRAVVLETTGDVSVIHATSESDLDTRLLSGVDERV